MNNTPLVSVVMPVYNCEDYLHEAVESILNQTYKNFELLILNDGSTDGTSLVVSAYKDQRIKIFKSAANMGIVYQLNRGLKEAKGRYIARMDGDDISTDDRLEKQVSFMEEHPEIGLCGSYARIFGKVNKPWTMRTSHNEIKYSLLSGASFSHPSVIIRKSVIDTYNFQYDAETFPVEDYALWSRMASLTRLANIPEFLVLYRSYETQISHRHHDQQSALMKLQSMANFKNWFFDPEIDESIKYQFELFLDIHPTEKRDLINLDSLLSRMKTTNRENRQFPIRLLRKELDALYLKKIIGARALFQLFLFIFSLNFFRRTQLLMKSIILAIRKRNQNV